MQHDYFKHLVKRYLEKKSTDEELEVFVHLMQQGKLDQYIQDEMDEEIEEEREEDQPNKRKNTLLRWPLAAAVTLLILSLGYAVFQQRTTGISYVNINNKKSSILKQNLPDGTTVWLNPNTTLSYPKKFGDLRKVAMSGEAFFEVTKDHAHPFVITSGKVITKVWGTSFRIRSIPGESIVKVSVLTGKVSVTAPLHQSESQFIQGSDRLKNDDARQILLLPQQEAIYKTEDHRLVKAPISESSDVTIWRKSSLSFENAPLKVITAELSKFYHVKLNIEEKELGDNTLTADFTDKNLADILVLICKSVHATYSKEKDNITLRTTIN
ncbi:MAG: FecR domain-containing protein [Pedobacter sp.]|uniref:FecR family protein n=1 Tax=Pedobacter sp. TaxID=1411316 RepID=UPI0033923CD4